MSYKIQVTVDDSMELWVKEQAKILGLSVSGLCNVALAQYKQQNEIISNMPKMMEMFSQAMKMQDMGGTKNISDVSDEMFREKIKKHDPNKKQRDFDSNMIEKGWDKI